MMRRSTFAVLLVAQTTVSFKACPPCPSIFVKPGTVINVSQISTPPLNLPGANATCGAKGWDVTLPTPQPPLGLPVDPATLQPGPSAPVPMPQPPVTPPSGTLLP